MAWLIKTSLKAQSCKHETEHEDEDDEESGTDEETDGAWRTSQLDLMVYLIICASGNLEPA